MEFERLGEDEREVPAPPDEDERKNALPWEEPEQRPKGDPVGPRPKEEPRPVTSSD